MAFFFKDGAPVYVYKAFRKLEEHLGKLEKRMGDISPPTAADYAWAEAFTAREEYRALCEKYDELTERVEKLERFLKEKKC